MFVTLTILIILLIVVLVHYLNIKKQLDAADNQITLLLVKHEQTFSALVQEEQTSKHLQEQLDTLTEDSKNRFETWKTQAESAIRDDANKRSRAVLRGQATEHLAPLLIQNWNHKDYRFLGDPIDYVIFNSISNVIDNTANEINEIILLDIKTGSSDLSKGQRRIRDAVEANKIKFCVYNIDTQQLKTWPKELTDDNLV